MQVALKDNMNINTQIKIKQWQSITRTDHKIKTAVMYFSISHGLSTFCLYVLMMLTALILEAAFTHLAACHTSLPTLTCLLAE